MADQRARLERHQLDDLTPHPIDPGVGVALEADMEGQLFAELQAVLMVARRRLQDGVERQLRRHPCVLVAGGLLIDLQRSEEHTSELQSLMRISYAVFCLKKKKCETINQHFA